MRVLVTGGAGFIGGHLVEALVAAGDEVVVLDDLSSGHRENLAAVAEQIDLRVGDVSVLADVVSAAEGCETIYHLAAIPSVPRSIEDPVRTNAVNFGGTLHVLEAARTVKARRVVLASSAAIYGDEPTGAVSEDATPDPMSPYAVEKLMSEHYLRAWADLFGLETVSLRFFNVFGPRQDPASAYAGVVSVFVDRMRKGEPITIFGDGEQSRDFVYVGDVVRALRLAGEVASPKGLICNVARGEATTLNALFGHLATLLNHAATPQYAEARAGDIRHSLADVSHAKVALGFSAEISVRTGLKRLLNV